MPLKKDEDIQEVTESLASANEMQVQLLQFDQNWVLSVDNMFFPLHPTGFGMSLVTSVKCQPQAVTTWLNSLPSFFLEWSFPNLASQIGFFKVDM